MVGVEFLGRIVVARVMVVMLGRGLVLTGDCVGGGAF